jgi:hypothetical protein
MLPAFPAAARRAERTFLFKSYGVNFFQNLKISGFKDRKISA